MILLSFSASIHAQTVSSSCDASDSVIAIYRKDAMLKALENTLENHDVYEDSIQINPRRTDTLLKAMLAVYNATQLPQRDSVVTLYDIHHFSYINPHYFSIKADSNTYWMQNLKAGNATSGHPYIDSLMTNLSLDSINFYDYVFTQPTVGFYTDSMFNFSMLSTDIDTIAGVSYMDLGYTAGDSDDILDSINGSSVILTYRAKWGDCPAGCMWMHYWTFEVNLDNCEVTFVESGGDSPVSVAEHQNLSTISVYPNPFSSSIQLNNNATPVDYELYTLGGQLVRSGKVTQEISGLEQLAQGAYLLQLSTQSSTQTFKIIKE